MRHEEWADATAAYALGALDADARAAFEQHLASCATCRAEVDELKETAAMLAHAAPAHAAPSASLRDRVLREARGVRPIGSARLAGRRRTPTSAWLAAAACLTLAALAGSQWRSERVERQQLALMLDSVRTDLAVRDSTIAAFFGPEVHVVSLSPTGEKPSMRVFWNHTRNIFIITAFNVPPAPEGKTYQLWAIQKDKAPLSMGTFNTDVNGRATAILAVGNNINDAGFIDLCGLTIEPAGGSPRPTEQPRLIGPWRHTD
ncbi:MAG: anti-sigma factor [Gemmatimonadaceae bacterium]